MGAGGPLEVLLDGKKWSAPISETPTLGSTETWVIVNPTADTHPIHLHLAQFQLVSRQSFQVNKYVTDWTTLNGMAPVPNDAIINNPPYQNYLQGKIVGPNPQEMGWKDTIQANPGEVTIIQVRFSPIDGTPNYPFDATNGPGYVWHCHILDHEDNEMMRPYTVT
jgi:spore coat protein A, manganese oxidase